MSKKIRPDVEYEDFSTLLEQCLKQAGKPLDLDAILRILHLPRKAKRDVQAALRELAAAGTVVRAGSGYAFAGKLKQVEGVVSVQRSGTVFLTRIGAGMQDIFLHPANLGDARHGDTVRAVVLPGRTGLHSEGRVVEVLHRGMVEVPVVPVRRQDDGLWVCTPSSPRIQTLFVVDVSALPKPPQPGGLLLVQPGESIGQGISAAVAVADVGNEESPQAQERLTKSLHGVPGAFPAEVLAEAALAPQTPPESDFVGRRDLRDTLFVTIDGADAKDFDDAIFVEETPAGFRLLVSIADVSHAVPEGSALDREALRRGNSWYFPQSVEPMLPHALSNGLCSLNPHTPRLVMTAEITFSATGAAGHTDFYPAVIQSAARLTYDQVKAGLLLDKPDTEALPKTVTPMLQSALKLARLLADVRRKRGSLDFDLPEMQIIFDEAGNIERIQPQERHWGHRLIEECMLAANEAVARFLQRKGVVFPYRLHPAPSPEKLETLTAYLAAAGLTGRTARAEESMQAGRPDQAQPARAGRDGSAGYTKRTDRAAGKKGAKPSRAPVLPDVRTVLRDVAGTPREYTVNRLVLRSMMQARYSPEEGGHFGLASECYCHFTSPIRRYADLMVHRALKYALELPGYGPPPSFVRQERICDDINACERSAMEAEREIHKRLAILHLRGHVGEEMDGVVSSVADFGLFVELPSVLCEGMVRLSFLTDDYYEYIPERQELRGRGTRRTFRPGDPLRVRLLEASLARLEIDLAPADMPTAAAATGGERRPSRPFSERPAQEPRGGRAKKREPSRAETNPREGRKKTVARKDKPARGRR